MAESQNIETVLTVNVDNLRKGNQEAIDSFSKVQDAAKKTETATKQVFTPPVNADKYKVTYTDLQKQVQELNEKLLNEIALKKESAKATAQLLNAKQKEKEAIEKTAASYKAAGVEMQKTTSLADQMKKGFAALGVTIGAAMAVRSIVNFGKESVTAFVEAEKSAQQLDFAIKNIAGGSDSDLERMLKLSQKLMGIYSHEEIEQAAKKMLNFGLTIKQVESLLPVMTDAAALSGKSLQELATAIDRGVKLGVMSRSALGQLGITFKDTGDEAENFRLIQEGLAKYAGGTSKMLDTQAGRLTNLKIQWGEFKEKLGEKFFGTNTSGLIGSLTNASKYLASNAGAVMGVLKALGLLISGIVLYKTVTFATTGVQKIWNDGKALSALLSRRHTAALAVETTATGAATVAQKGFNTAIKSNPIGLLLTGIIALGIAIASLVKKTKEASDSTKELASNTEKYLEVQKGLADTNKSIAANTEKELQSATALFDILKDSTAGRETQKKAIDSINAIYGDFLGYQIDEKTNLADLTIAYETIARQLIANREIKLKTAEIDTLLAKREVSRASEQIYLSNLTSRRKELADLQAELRTETNASVLVQISKRIEYAEKEKNAAETYLKTQQETTLAIDSQIKSIGKQIVLKGMEVDVTTAMATATEDEGEKKEKQLTLMEKLSQEKETLMKKQEELVVQGEIEEAKYYAIKIRQIDELIEKYKNIIKRINEVSQEELKEIKIKPAILIDEKGAEEDLQKAIDAVIKNIKTEASDIIADDSDQVVSGGTIDFMNFFGISAEGMSEEQLKNIEKGVSQIKKELYDTALSITSELLSMQEQRIERELALTIKGLEKEETAELDALKKKKEKGLITEENYTKKELEIQKKFADKKNAEDKKAFENAKKMKQAQLWVNYAAATIQLYAENHWILATVLAGLLAIEAGIQSANIANQEYVPQYEKGGLIEGKSHKQGGKMINVEGGEYHAIFNKKIMASKERLQLSGTPLEIASNLNSYANTGDPFIFNGSQIKQNKAFLDGMKLGFDTIQMKNFVSEKSGKQEISLKEIPEIKKIYQQMKKDGKTIIYENGRRVEKQGGYTRIINN